MSQDWISFHIFYEDNLDRLLVEGVRPILRQLQDTRAIQGYFFVRYWNGGRHIRLRLAPSGLHKGLTTIVQYKLESFLAQCPGGNGMSDVYSQQVTRMQELQAYVSREWRMFQHELETIELLQPPNSVQWRPYRFDSKRYGGQALQPVTEAHFCRSSQIAMAIVSHSIGRIQARLSLALRLMAIVPIALKLSSKVAADLFWKSTHMLSYVYPEQGENFIASFGFLPFEEQRVELGDIFHQLQVSLLSDQSSLVDALLQVWRSELEDCEQVLQRLWEKQDLSIHPNHIVMDYLHMLNNRLGIALPEECYLYYLVAKACEETDASYFQQ
jgi:thiopeptide-type bacteriocin biosynthesis protein